MDKREIGSFSSKRKKYPLLQTFSFAFKGIWKTIVRERNMKIHVAAGSLAVLLGFLLKVGRLEWTVLVILISCVMAFEIMNSAVEAACDLMRFKLKLDYWETYWIRNFAAGSVMVLAVGAAIVGLLLFIPKIL